MKIVAWSTEGVYVKLEFDERPSIEEVVKKVNEALILKPCPFCGGKAHWFETVDFGHCVECTNCKAIVGFNSDDKTACVYTTSEDARNAWNRREPK